MRCKTDVAVPDTLTDGASTGLSNQIIGLCIRDGVLGTCTRVEYRCRYLVLVLVASVLVIVTSVFVTCTLCVLVNFCLFLCVATFDMALMLFVVWHALLIEP